MLGGLTRERSKDSLRYQALARGGSALNRIDNGKEWGALVGRERDSEWTGTSQSAPLLPMLAVCDSESGDEPGRSNIAMRVHIELGSARVLRPPVSHYARLVQRLGDRQPVLS